MIVRGRDISLLPVGCPVKIVACDPKYPEGAGVHGMSGHISDPKILLTRNTIQHVSDIVSQMDYDHRSQAATGYVYCHLTLGDAVEVIDG